MNTTVVGGWSEGVIGEYLNLSRSIYIILHGGWEGDYNSTTAFMYVVIYIYYYYIYIYMMSTYSLYDLDKYLYYDVCI